MSKSQHRHQSMQLTQNQNNEMSDDPAGGSRHERAPSSEKRQPVEKKPGHDRQDQSTIEAFGEEGVGIAAKE